jgi:hypothetical protein
MTPEPVQRWICTNKVHVRATLSCTKEPVPVMLPQYHTGEHKWSRFPEKPPAYQQGDKVVVIADVVNAHLTKDGTYDYLVDVDYDVGAGTGLRTWLPESSIQGKQPPPEPDPYAVDYVTDHDGVNWSLTMTSKNGMRWVEDLSTGPEDRWDNPTGDPTEPRELTWSQLCEISTPRAFKEVPL